MADTLEELQNQINLMYSEWGFDRASIQTLMLGAVEELGELSEAILLTSTQDFTPSQRKRAEHPERFLVDNVSYEVGDIITYLLALCNKMDISPKFKWIDRPDWK